MVETLQPHISSTLVGESRQGFEIYGDLGELAASVAVSDHGASIGEEQPAFRVRTARPRPVLPESAALVARRYGDRGYKVTPTQQHPNLYTFGAYDAGSLAGTVAIRLDSSAGLAADRLYKPEVDNLRATGYRFAEFTRLALEAQSASKEVLAALFHTAYLFAHVVRGFSHAVIEVNPRHVAFYRRVLFFTVLAEERHNARVDAPAVLLGLDFNRITDELRTFRQHQALRTHQDSFFAHAFSLEDESGVVARLRRFDCEA